jgi:hypothetical protein
VNEKLILNLPLNFVITFYNAITKIFCLRELLILTPKRETMAIRKIYSSAVQDVKKNCYMPSQNCTNQKLKKSVEILKNLGHSVMHLPSYHQDLNT